MSTKEINTRAAGKYYSPMKENAIFYGGPSNGAKNCTPILSGPNYMYTRPLGHPLRANGKSNVPSTKKQARTRRKRF